MDLALIYWFPCFSLNRLLYFIDISIVGNNQKVDSALTDKDSYWRCFLGLSILYFL